MLTHVMTTMFVASVLASLSEITTSDVCAHMDITQALRDATVGLANRSITEKSNTLAIYDTFLSTRDRRVLVV